MTARLATAARQDLAEAIIFYEQCKKGLSGEFIDDLEQTLGYLYQLPFSGRGIGRNVRVLPVGYFPHKLVYQPRVDEIFVLAITDKQRSPDYWLRRASK